MADEVYCYPNSNILKNKADIRDEELLMKFERKESNKNAAQLIVSPLRGNFDLQHLQSIHRILFGDIYDWAGKLRTVDIAKGNMFCSSMYLKDYSKDIFNGIKNDNYLIGMKKDDAVRKLAGYLGDINALHPFREGNGRTQRIFIYYLGMMSGLRIDYSKTNKEEMLEASKASFLCDNSLFEEIFRRISTEITPEEQRLFAEGIAVKGSELERAIKPKAPPHRPKQKR